MENIIVFVKISQGATGSRRQREGRREVGCRIDIDWVKGGRPCGK